MLTMFPGKRQWQRVVDADAHDKQPGEQDEDDIVITDKTRLLSSESSVHPCFDEDPSDACTYVYVDQAGENELPAQVTTWKHDRVRIEPLFPCVDLSNFDRFQETHIAESTCSSRSCSHASWQGFKQLVKKQFMPPFPFRKDMPLEEMAHLRQRRGEGVMNKSCGILGASTNLVELRKLDAKIQNGRNKSAFAASTEGCKSKENMTWGHDQNAKISKAVKRSSPSETSLNEGMNNEVMKTKSSKSGAKESSFVRENGILRKLKRQSKKENVLFTCCKCKGLN